MIPFSEDENTVSAAGFFKAASQGDLPFIKKIRFSEGNIDINCADSHGCTALIYASANGHFDVVKYLSEQGAEANIKDSLGWTALAFAALNGHLKTVQYLIENGGADKNAKDKDNWTVLMYAVLKNHTDVVQYLLKKGVQYDVENNQKQTAEMMAVLCGHSNLKQFFVKTDDSACINNQRANSKKQDVIKSDDISNINITQDKHRSLWLKIKDLFSSLIAYASELWGRCMKFLSPQPAFGSKTNADIRVFKNECDADHTQEGVWSFGTQSDYPEVSSTIRSRNTR